MNIHSTVGILTTLVVLNTANPPAVFAQDWVGTQAPPYLKSDGTVDITTLRSTAQKLDCKILASYKQLEADKNRLELDNAALQKLMGDIQDNALSKATKAVEDLGFDKLIDSIKKSPAPANVKASVAVVEAAMNVVGTAEHLLFLAQQKASKSSIATFESNVRLSKESALQTMEILNLQWKEREHYRSDLVTRLGSVPEEFNTSCESGAGWKAIKSLQVAAGETFEDWSGVDTECTYQAASTAKDYLAIRKQEEEANANGFCKNTMLISDTEQEYSVSMICPYGDEMKPYTLTYKKQSDERIEMVASYDMGEYGHVSKVVVYERCTSRP